MKISADQHSAAAKVAGNVHLSPCKKRNPVPKQLYCTAGFPYTFTGCVKDPAVHRDSAVSTIENDDTVLFGDRLSFDESLIVDDIFQEVGGNPSAQRHFAAMCGNSPQVIYAQCVSSHIAAHQQFN